MKTNVAVLFGGASVEHEVSIISAVQAMNNMNKEKYNIIPIYISKTGEMYNGENMLDIELFKNIENMKKSCHPVTIVNHEKKVYMKYLDKSFIKNRKPVEIHVAFPIVHGTNCEDGSVAGLCELLGLAYVGCDVLSAALGMDKAKFKTILSAKKLPVLDCICFTSRQWSESRNELILKFDSQIGYPAIVKPVNLGSSVGITKVENQNELIDAINLSLSFSESVLIEKAINNLREINCSVVGDCDECEASVLEEPVMHDKILSYDDKYMSGAGKHSKGMASLGRQLPASLSNQKTAEIQDLAKKAFMAFNASGVCRIDFLIDTDNNDKVYINEANTIPGSLSFYLWEASGLKYSQLIDKLIALAFKRDRKRKNLMFTIQTNILSSTSFSSKGSKNSKI